MKNDNRGRDEQRDQSDQARWMRSLGYFSIIVGDLVGFSAAGIGLGYWLVKKWNAPWWVLLLTSMTGLCLSMFRLYRMTQRDVE
jgi:F0F1-type ATP synthase assembly protein I